MQITIGGFKGDAVSAYGDPQLLVYLAKEAQLMGLRPRTIYRWNCLIGNHPTSLQVALPGVFMWKYIADNGLAVRVRSASQKRFVLQKSTGGSQARFAGLLARQYQPISQTVALPASIPFDHYHKIEVGLIARYRYFWVTPRPNPLGMRYVLGLPVGYMVFWKITGFCDAILPEPIGERFVIVWGLPGYSPQSLAPLLIDTFHDAVRRMERTRPNYVRQYRPAFNRLVRQGAR